MTMTCEHVDQVLSAFLEGDLGADEHRAVETHLRECLRCAALVRDIEGLRREAASLPALEPSRDLWAGIAERIEAPVIELTPRLAPAPQRRTWQLAAAAVVLIAASSGITYTLATREQDNAPAPVVALDSANIATPVAVTSPNVVTPSRPSSGSGSTLLVRAEPMAPEVMYGQEITRLRAILEQRRANLDSATVSAVEKSLEAIDLAIADARAALAADAQSQFLNEQLNRSLERKVGILRRVALMPMGAS